MKTIEGRFLSHADACSAAVSTGADQTRRTPFNRLHRVRAAGVLFPRSNLSTQAAVAPVVVSGTIGKRVRVRYPLDDEGRSGAWYNGVITAFNDEKHTILFDVDGKPDDLKLSDETFRIRAAP